MYLFLPFSPVLLYAAIPHLGRKIFMPSAARRRRVLVCPLMVSRFIACVANCVGTPASEYPVTQLEFKEFAAVMMERIREVEANSLAPGSNGGKARKKNG